MDMNYRGGMWEGGGGQDGVECVWGKWDNCNSIINKYILKKTVCDKPCTSRNTINNAVKTANEEAVTTTT